MRKINKFLSPEFYNEWLRISELTGNITYDCIESSVREDLKRLFLMEQGYICAYTGMQIQMDDCHIEHVKPQSACKKARRAGKHNREDVEYNNMVACFPSYDKNADFGARLNNGESWSENCFISPLEEGCESRFIFSIDGKISCKDDDEEAKKTISRLKLDHPILVDIRKDAILGFLGMKENMLPIAESEARLLREDFNHPMHRYPAFVFALKQVLDELFP